MTGTETGLGPGLGLGPLKSVPWVDFVSLKISNCPWVSLNFSEVSLTPRDTLDSTVSLVFSWCLTKLLSVPYVSFKYLKCPSSLGTLLISYCSSKVEDFHQCSPKYQCSLTGVTLLIAQCLLEDVGAHRYPKISVSLGSLIAHCPSEVGCVPFLPKM